MPSYSSNLDSYFSAETVRVVSLFIDVFDDKNAAVSRWDKKALIRMLANFDFIHRIQKRELKQFQGIKVQCWCLKALISTRQWIVP